MTKFLNVKIMLYVITCTCYFNNVLLLLLIFFIEHKHVIKITEALNIDICVTDICFCDRLR